MQYSTRLSSHILILILLSVYIGVCNSEHDGAQKISKWSDGTTTAIPLLNKSNDKNNSINSKSNANNTTHMSIEMTTTATTVSAIEEKSTHTTASSSVYTTKIVVHSTSTHDAKLSTTTPIPSKNETGSDSAKDNNSNEYPRFDILSFMGGCLFTTCVVTIGAFAWKIYEAKIERRYLTI